MSFIATTSTGEAQGAVAEMYERQQAHWGYVPNYAHVFSHRPEVLARWGQLLAEIKRTIEPRRFELATFAAAHELGNTACALAHGGALRPFLGDDDIVALAEQRTDGVVDAADRAVLGFARLVARDATQVTAADIEALRAQGLGDAEIFDLVAAVAGRAFFTKLLDALGVLADAPMAQLPAPLAQALTLRRPVDTRPCATMPTR